MRKTVIAFLVIFSFSCTPAQRNWRQNLYLDISAGGEDGQLENTITSTGASYPFWFGIWASAGVWNDFYGNWGPYWGFSYAFAPFSGLKLSDKKEKQSE